MNKPQSNIKKKILAVDWLLVFITLCASGFGILVVKSATNYTHSLRATIVQCGAAVIGLGIAFFMSSLDYDHVMKYSKYFYAAAAALLIATLLFGTGEEDKNAQRWLNIPFIGIGIQPSEFAKIFFIVTFAKHIDTVKEHINKPLTVLGLGIHLLVIVGLVLMQNDLGSALVFVFIFVVMCFVSGISLWYVLASAFLLVALSPLIWNIMGEFRQDRLIYAFYPELDPFDNGWQVMQSMKAIGSGGIFGAGYQQGYIIQSSNQLSQRESDMVFAAVGEEFGVIGTLSVILMFVFLLLRIFRVSKLARNDSGMLLCTGVMAMFMAQSVVNIGMCISLMPVTGITLPFFSSGGSSMLASWIGIGIVLSVYSRRSIYYFNQDEDML